jgi:DNA-binding LytR/AlgR family response regulator
MSSCERGKAALIRIAIVEDELPVQQKLKRYIEKFSEENTTQFKIEIFSDGDEILSEYEAKYDIILLDIQMKRLDGMETARRIRTFDEDVILIFITNMADYAIQGYAVEAMDFVVKPIPYFAFSEQLKKAVGRLSKRKKNHVTFRADRGVMRLSTAKIHYVESFNHHVVLHAETEDYRINSTITAMDQQLSPYSFCRCNNCYLINLEYVEKVKQNIVIVAGHELQISRSKRKGFMEALADYIGGVTH